MIRKLLEKAAEIKRGHGYDVKRANDYFEENRLKLNPLLAAASPIKIGDIVTVVGGRHAPNRGKEFKVETIGYYRARTYGELCKLPRVKGSIIKRDGTLGVTKLSMSLEIAIDAMEPST